MSEERDKTLIEVVEVLEAKSHRRRDSSLPYEETLMAAEHIRGMIGHRPAQDLRWPIRSGIRQGEPTIKG